MNKDPKIDTIAGRPLADSVLTRVLGRFGKGRADDLEVRPRAERTLPETLVKTTTPQADLETARDRRRREQRRRTWRNVGIAVLGPTLLALIYYALIDPPEYTCTTEYTIRGRLKPAPDLLAGLGIPATTGTQNDAFMAVDYLNSPNTVQLLRARYGFNEAYGRFSLDPTARLDPRSPIEFSTKYWTHKIKAAYDNSADATTVTVTAYTPQDALRLTQGVLESASRMVDYLNTRVQQGSLTQAIVQVNATKRDYDAAKAKLAELQGSVNALTFDSQTKEAVAEVQAIDSALAGLNVNLGTVQATFKPDAPQAKAILAQIANLQAARERAMGQAKGAPGVSAAAHDVLLQAALLDYQFTQKAYLSAQDNLLAAQPESQDKDFVVSFVQPTLPQQSNYWERFLMVIAVFFGSLVVFGVGALGYSVIKDHIQ